MAPADKLAVGIDFGTSTSEICVFIGGKTTMIPDPISQAETPVMPSLVAMSSKGVALVGEAARNQVDRPGYGVREVKRLMGTDKKVTLQDRQYRPEELAAVILRRLLDNAEEALGRNIHRVVLTVPANATDAAREATRRGGAASLATPDSLEAQGIWNWETMLDAARKLTHRSGDGAAMRYGLQTKYWGTNLISRPMRIWANGGDVIDYPANPNNFVMDTPAALEALQFVQDLLWTYEVLPKPNERSAFGFGNGKLAMDDDTLDTLLR